MIPWIGTTLSCLVGFVTWHTIMHLEDVKPARVKVPSYTEGIMMTTDTDVKGLA